MLKSNSSIELADGELLALLSVGMPNCDFHVQLQASTSAQICYRKHPTFTVYL